MEQNVVLPCVIPAAGLSSRMGAWKPLLPWKGGTVCGAVAETVLGAGLSPIIVAGFRASDLMAAFADRSGVAVVENADWKLGMLGSLRVGAAAARAAFPDAPGFLVSPADMPLIPAEAYRLVADAGLRLYASKRPEAAVFACKGDRRGHPVYVPMSFVDGMAALDPDSRLRSYLDSRGWTRVNVDSDGIFLDIDSPDEYIAACRS